MASGRPICILGAGIGGLAAALDLAARGREVLLLEAAPGPGGRIAEVAVGGRALDSGPTVLTMREVFDALCAAAGTTLESEVTLRRLTSLGRHCWGEARLDLPADPAAAEAAIGDFAGAAAARGFRDFRARAARIHRTLDQPLLRNPRPSAILLAREAGMRGLLGIAPFATLWDALAEHFPDPRLRQLFARSATYVGASPLQAPATLMLIAHIELAGLWQVEGGLLRLPEALARMAAARGATLRYGAPVAEVLARGGRAAALRLADGTVQEAAAVIANVDPASIGAGRLGAAAARAVPGVAALRRSFSAVTWAMLARAVGPLARRTVAFAEHPTAEYAEIGYRGRLPAAPTVALWAPDRGEDGAPATPGEERVLALVSAPARGDAPADPEGLARLEDAAFAGLARAGIALERGATLRTTPWDWERRFPGTGGALYGPSVAGWQSSFTRPTARTKLPGFYLAGGGTHPGAGVSIAAVSGRFAAAALLEDQP